MPKTIFLTGSPCRKGQDSFTSDNGFKEKVLSSIPKDPEILFVSAAPDDPDYNKSVFDSMRLCFERSGINCSKSTLLYRDNASQAKDLVAKADMVVLCGGHTPTQNKFLNEMDFRDIIQAYDGVVMGCSAGSMNCADWVYAHPELKGESVDPSYRRVLRGLGLTDICIVPHYEDVRYSYLDGKRLFEDIIFPDSYQKNFIVLRDGGYIEIKDGRTTLYGESWIIKDGNMRRICLENETYRFMNVIFISPAFPQTYSHFCAGLKANGVNVLGIAETPYNELNDELKASLTEYYRVDSLEDYSQVFKAVAFFSFKYGKIDFLESNNEYWLEQDARLRTDFNITSGIQNDHIAAIKNKSEMKKYYALGNVPTARQIKGAEGYKAVKAFAKLTGYPIIAKPDNGVGAHGTYKINSDAELKDFFDSHANDYQGFVVEEFITGQLCSYDAVYNSKSEPIFESMGVYPIPIMDVVHGNLDTYYYIEKKVPAALAKLGRQTVKAFGVFSRFVHLEFFKLDRDREGLGKKGDFVGLEVNMRPAGGFTPDMMNFAHSTDVFKIWADMVAFDERKKGEGDQYFCAYASRRDEHNYVYTHEQVLEKYGSKICMCDRMPDALADALGNQVYIARFDTKKEIEEFFDFVCKKN